MWRRWYHGRLDRYGAEARLREYGKLGGYLVRESDRKPGSYVLSYLGRTGINHFRITAVCGDFYIGGRPVESLSPPGAGPRAPPSRCGGRCRPRSSGASSAC